MKNLTLDKVSSRIKARRWAKLREICQRHEFPCFDVDLLMAIYVIESFFRPFPIRIVEYIAVFLSAAGCLICGSTIKNYTIGIFQLGLSTILNFYGGNYYQHAKNIRIFTFQEMKNLFSVISSDKAISILFYRLNPIISKAQKIYPNSAQRQLRYIGEQYNGHYAYGLLFADVYKQIKKVIS